MSAKDITAPQASAFSSESGVVVDASAWASGDIQMTLLHSNFVNCEVNLSLERDRASPEKGPRLAQRLFPNRKEEGGLWAEAQDGVFTPWPDGHGRHV